VDDLGRVIPPDHAVAGAHQIHGQIQRQNVLDLFVRQLGKGREKILF
jgi:hypothetical protein